MASYKGIGDDVLPPVPNGGMKGLRSFMRNFNRTRPATSQADATQLLTVQSADYNYHAHMNQQAG